MIQLKMNILPGKSTTWEFQKQETIAHVTHFLNQLKKSNFETIYRLPIFTDLSPIFVSTNFSFKFWIPCDNFHVSPECSNSVSKGKNDFSCTVFVCSFVSLVRFNTLTVDNAIHSCDFLLLWFCTTHSVSFNSNAHTQRHKETSVLVRTLSQCWVERYRNHS